VCLLRQTGFVHWNCPYRSHYLGHSSYNGTIGPSQPFLWRTWSTEFELAHSIPLSGQSKASADGGQAVTDVSGVAAAGGELFRKALAPLLESGKADNVCATSPWRPDVMRTGLVEISRHMTARSIARFWIACRAPAHGPVSSPRGCATLGRRSRPRWPARTRTPLLCLPS
jgi:hypothetical protein